MARLGPSKETCWECGSACLEVLPYDPKLDTEQYPFSSGWLSCTVCPWTEPDLMGQ